MNPVQLHIPTGIFANIAGKSGENAGLDGVNQSLWNAMSRNKVIPAASGDLLWIQFENPVGERIPLVMVKEQPAIQMFFSERDLNFFDMHDGTQRLMLL